MEVKKCYVMLYVIQMLYVTLYVMWCDVICNTNVICYVVLCWNSFEIVYVSI